MSHPEQIQIIVGTANWGYPDNFWGQSDENILKAFSLIKKYGYTKLDTAQAYQGAEARLGALKAGAEHRLVLDTKWRAGYDFTEGANSREYMLKSAKKSLDSLSVPQVDVFYLHAPVRNAPIEETLAGVNDAFLAGLFRRFGLSNYPAAEVQAVHDICRLNGYVLPSVYQGNYSAVARKQEDDLFPLLHKLGISFLAYSPIAGGFLTKTRAQIEAGGTRFSPDQMYGIYHKLYIKDSYLAGLEQWGRIAKELGVSGAELAYRWIVHHSALRPEFGDGIVIGSSSLQQLEDTLLYCNKGPLSTEAALQIEKIWESVKHEAGVDNFQAVMGN